MREYLNNDDSDFKYEAGSWIVNDGPTDLDGIKTEMAGGEVEPEDIDWYAGELKDHIDELLDKARELGRDCAAEDDDRLGSPEADLEDYIKEIGYRMVGEERPAYTQGRAAEKAWREGYLEAKREQYEH